MKRFSAHPERAVFQVRHLAARNRRLEGVVQLALAQADHAQGCGARGNENREVGLCTCWRRWAMKAVGTGEEKAKAA